MNQLFRLNGILFKTFRGPGPSRSNGGYVQQGRERCLYIFFEKHPLNFRSLELPKTNTEEEPKPQTIRPQTSFISHSPGGGCGRPVRGKQERLANRKKSKNSRNSKCAWMRRTRDVVCLHACVSSDRSRSARKDTVNYIKTLFQPSS